MSEASGLCSRSWQRLRRRSNSLAPSARSGLPPRQRSLRATLAWSYELLPDGLRRFLRRLSIFRGAFCAQGAAAVTGEELAGELLVHLRGYSLVGRVTDDRGHGFVLLETVREFLAQQLEPDEAPGLAERHARWYLSLVSTPAPDPLETAWRQERAVANIRVALAWALANDTEAALVAATALDPFWELRGNHVEGCGWLVAALAAAPHAPAALRGAAASVYGRLACYALPQDRAQAVLEQAVADLRAADAPVVARFQALLFLCIVATARDDAAAVDAAHAEAAALAAADGSPVARFFLLNTVYHQALLRRDYDAALAALRANSEVVASLGDPVLTLRHLAQQAFVEVACGELAAAEATLAAIPAEPLGSVRGVWTLQAAFAEVRLRYRQGRRAESVALLAAVADQIAGSVPVHAHHAAEFVSQVLSDRGRHNDALAWLEVGARWRAQWGVVYDFALDADDRARIRAAAEAALSPAQAQAATASGLGWTTETLAEALRELPEVAAAATSAGPRVAMLG